jgi:lysophospholipase L1-like esterase
MIWMPEGPSFQRHYSPRARQEMGQWLEKLAAEAEVRMVDCRDWMAEEDFSDGHHLLPAGAVRWSQRIAQEVLADMVRE